MTGFSRTRLKDVYCGKRRCHRLGGKQSLYPLRDDRTDRGSCLGAGHDHGTVLSGISDVGRGPAEEETAPPEKPADTLRGLRLRMNEKVCSYAAEHEVASMGTTAAMLYFTGREATVCNIGDSRIFRFRSGEIIQLSVDHTGIAAYGVKHPLYQYIGIPAEKEDTVGSAEGTMTYLRGIVSDFVREIQVMESLKGVQNIVNAEDYKVVEKGGRIGWDIYIRMELLTPFLTYIQVRPPDEKTVIRLGCDICTALELCAKQNVIHRDIKPENIFVNSFGDFKPEDFGIARNLENATGGLSQKGTYNYMAPEVQRGRQYDTTVDLYSLGMVLYRLMNRNRQPFGSPPSLLSM